MIDLSISLRHGREPALPFSTFPLDIYSSSVSLASVDFLLFDLGFHGLLLHCDTGGLSRSFSSLASRLGGSCSCIYLRRRRPHGHRKRVHLLGGAILIATLVRTVGLRLGGPDYGDYRRQPDCLLGTCDGTHSLVFSSLPLRGRLASNIHFDGEPHRHPYYACIRHACVL